MCGSFGIVCCVVFKVSILNDDSSGGVILVYSWCVVSVIILFVNGLVLVVGLISIFVIILCLW